MKYIPFILLLSCYEPIEPTIDPELLDIFLVVKSEINKRGKTIPDNINVVFTDDLPDSQRGLTQSLTCFINRKTFYGGDDRFREYIVAHEVGHAAGLKHGDCSIMTSSKRVYEMWPFFRDEDYDNYAKSLK